MSDWIGGARFRVLAVALLAVALAVAAFGLAARARLPRAEFTFTNGGEVSSLDPHAVSGVPEGRIVRALFEGLLTRDPKTLRAVPGVAESWQVSPDGLLYTFQLREGARWSNGDALTAEDFAWSLRRVLEPETASPNATALWCIAGAREYASSTSRGAATLGIRAVDAHTLELRLAHPTPYFLDLLASYPFAPVHRASLEALQSSDPDHWSTAWTQPEHLVCNGPYRLLERRINDRIRLAKNEHYWDAAQVAFASIDALAVESWTTALNLYLTGEVDWVDGSIPTSAVRALKRREDFESAHFLGLYFYRLNTTKPPLDDPRVRRALALALQRQEICELVLQAGQKPSLSFVPWGAIGRYRSPRTPDENPAKASTLLASAGFGAKGRPFPTLEIHYNSSEVHRDIAEVVAAQWHDALGIDVRLSNQEWKVFLDAQRNLEYEVSRSSWIADWEDPSTFLEIWTSDSENNRTGWSDARYDDLIARARVERDAAKRNALFQQAEALLLEAMPAIPIYSYVSQNLVSRELDGFFPNALNEHFPKAWRWKDQTRVARERASRVRVAGGAARSTATERPSSQANPAGGRSTPKPRAKPKGKR